MKIPELGIYIYICIPHYFCIYFLWWRLREKLLMDGWDEGCSWHGSHSRRV